MKRNLYRHIIKKYYLMNNIKLYFSLNNSIIYILNKLGLIKLKLPSIYFYYKKNNINNLILLNNNYYKSIISNFFYFYKKINFIYFIKLKIKGLGYRIRKVTTNLFYLFFNYTNIYYFNIPRNVIIKWYKKRLILVSWNFNLIKLLMSTIIILKSIGPYQIRGLKYPKEIILLKKKKKNF